MKLYSPFEIINTLIAIAAFALSLYNFIVRLRDRTPYLRVQIAFVADPLKLLEDFFVCRIFNLGQQPVHIERLFFYWRASFFGKEEKIDVFGRLWDKEFPVDLQPSCRFAATIPKTAFQENLTNHLITRKGKIFLRVGAVDGVGRIYKSNVQIFDAAKGLSEQSDSLIRNGNARVSGVTIKRMIGKK